MKLERAADAQDSRQVASAAHALKSMCYNIGAVQLGTMLDTIETQALEDRLIPNQSALLDVGRSMQATGDELRQIAGR